MPIDFETGMGTDKNNARRPASSAAENDAPTASIDIAKFKEYFPYEGEDVTMIRELAQEFLDDTEKRLKTLEEACQRNDAVVVGEEAHSIKGASLSFGAVIFSQLSIELEMIGKSGNLKNAEEKLEQLQAEFTKMRAELLRILAEMQP